MAEEVRGLAQRSAQAARESAGRIDDAVHRTTQGVEISAKVAAALEAIASHAREVDEVAATVAGASRQQSQGITQLSAAINQMDEVTQSNAAGAEESASAAEELNAQAESMRVSVSELEFLAGIGRQARTSAPKTRAWRPARAAKGPTDTTRQTTKATQTTKAGQTTKATHTTRADHGDRDAAALIAAMDEATAAPARVSAKKAPSAAARPRRQPDQVLVPTDAEWDDKSLEDWADL